MANEKIKLTRTLGFEIECGVNVDVDDESLNIDYLDEGYDGSVEGFYHESGMYPAELRTEPISDLNIVSNIYDRLNGEYDLGVNRSCGLHIHVDINDFDLIEMAKLLRFGKGIEHVMYAIVGSDRDGNSYCEPLHEQWRKVFRSSFIEQPLQYEQTWSGLRSIEELTNFINSNKKKERSKNIWNGKYQWLNTNTIYGTCEFRIFNSTTDGELAIKYGMLAYHIVETVKNSTIEQLNFIIKGIYESHNIFEAMERFYNSIGLDEEFHVNPQNSYRVQKMEEKFFLPNRQPVAQVENDGEAV